MPVLAESALSGNEAIAEKGYVTIVASGDPNHSLGDEIEFFGKNTETYKTYLFITGPGLAENGSQIQNMDPGRSAVENGNPDTFKQMDVQGNHTWYWKWDTTNYALAEGVYTIYAVAWPYDKDHLEKTPYGTTSITIKKSAESVTTTPSGNKETVLPGCVTIVAAGNQSYFLGDEIQFSGTSWNTASDLTYLFITGPNLPEQGSQIQNPDPVHWAVENGNPSTFQQAGVKSDHTWYWKWDTANYGLADGVYTIYVVARPRDKGHLEETPYGTVSIILGKRSVTATASPSAITGTAPVATTTPAAPSATPTRSPGFGTLMALIGLSVGAFIVMCRR
jgi:hypothetical protein